MAKDKKALKILDKPFGIDAHIDEVAAGLSMLPVNLSRSNMIEDALSTGSLVVDLITGGGYLPGIWCTIRGESGAGKSSLSYFSIKNAHDWQVPVHFFDHEGSTSPDYLERIVGMPLEKIMGVKDAKGKYTVLPLIRYYQPSLGEDTFRFLNRVFRQFPSKVELNGSWYLVYDNSFKSEIEGGNYEHIRKGDKYYVKVADGSAQTLIFIDSLASMFPESRDENDTASPMAKMARMFSDNLPMVKGKLASKRITIVATNQMRLKPMSMGDPRYEVGGEAVKYYPDLIIDMKPVSASTVKEGKGPILEEECWDGEGVDKYRFSKIFIPKNKKFSPFRGSLIRIWFEHKGESGYGIDPFFDCKQYLRETGQIVEGRSYELLVPGLWNQRKWTPREFKELVLNPDKLEVFSKYGLKDPELSAFVKEVKDLKGQKLSKIQSDKLQKLLLEKMDILHTCRVQLKSGDGFKRYFDTISGANSVDTTSVNRKLKDDDEVSDDEDDES